MSVSPADFELYSRSTGTPLPRTPDERMRMAPEVHNFVRQIINKSGPSILFYNWILNSKNTKLICLSGTPIINKPSEIAVLFNMIRGMTRVYNFTIKLKDDEDEITLFEKLKDIFYKEHSPVYQIQVKRYMGKYLISFMQNTTKFESIMNPDNKIVYTIQYRNHDFKSFIKHIYAGLHKITKDEDINPSEKIFVFSTILKVFINSAY